MELHEILVLANEGPDATLLRHGCPHSKHGSLVARSADALHSELVRGHQVLRVSFEDLSEGTITKLLSKQVVLLERAWFDL